MTGLLTRPIVSLVKATSSAVELRPYCAAMHSYPSACRGTINLLKQEPSAQSPWQNTMLVLVCISPPPIECFWFAPAGAVADDTTFGAPGDTREASPTLKVSNHYEPNDRYHRNIRIVRLSRFPVPISQLTWPRSPLKGAFCRLRLRIVATPQG